MTLCIMKVLTSLPPLLLHAWSPRTFAGHFLTCIPGSFVLQQETLHYKGDIYDKFHLCRPYTYARMTILWNAPHVICNLSFTGPSCKVIEMQNEKGEYLLEMRDYGDIYGDSWDSMPDVQSDPVLQDIWNCIAKHKQ